MAMLEALRGLGYSTAAALADIIDNSISAGATEVRVDFAWHGPVNRISVLDDGRGMDDAELESAMRLGDKNPLDARAGHRERGVTGARGQVLPFAIANGKT